MTARISNEDESKRTRVDLRDTLAARVRATLDREADAAIGEKRMFGVLAFLHNGNLLGYVSAYGLTVRLAKDDQAAAQLAPFGQRCVVSGRRMPGYVLLDHSAVKTDRQLDSWLRAALDYVGSLPRREVLLRARSARPWNDGKDTMRTKIAST